MPELLGETVTQFTTALRNEVGETRIPFGVRRQSEAATALWIRFMRGQIQSGVALRLPPALHKVVSIRDD
jgi:hypothetical protein